MNSKIVDDKGIINLRDNSYAKVFSVDAIDLSLTSNTQKNNFFHQLKYLYQLKDLDLRIYKLDDKIDLNANKDYYKKLMEEYSNEEDKIKFLQERYDNELYFDEKITMMNFDSKMSGFDIAKLIQKNKN